MVKIFTKSPSSVATVLSRNPDVVFLQEVVEASLKIKAGTSKNNLSKIEFISGKVFPASET